MVKTQVFKDACHSLRQSATLSCEEVLKPSASLTSEVSTRRDAAAQADVFRSADGLRLVCLQYFYNFYISDCIWAFGSTI